MRPASGPDVASGWLRKPEDCRARDRYTRPMTTEPRDPALAALARATVRVGTGSGVVIRGASVPLIATAAHVLEGDDLPIVRKGSIFGEASVVGRDPDLDVALLTGPRELEALALMLASDKEAARPGDQIWGAGFPGGLEGTDPALVPGAIASVGEQSWANLDGTWGNSGGPICRVVDGSALVVGVLLGNASEANELLLRWSQKVAEASEDSARRAAEAKAAIAGLLADIETVCARGVERSEVHLLMELVGQLFVDQSVSLKIQDQVNGFTASLIEQHFRAGFLRFAPVADLRKVLGPGDGRPSL